MEITRSTRRAVPTCPMLKTGYTWENTPAASPQSERQKNSFIRPMDATTALMPAILPKQIAAMGPRGGSIPSPVFKFHIYPFSIRRKMRDLYSKLKGKVYGLACTTTSKDNPAAQKEGFSDVFDLIMSDSDHNRQAFFLMMLPHQLSEKQRQILLDGMAKEYQNCEGWMAYVDRECA